MDVQVEALESTFGGGRFVVSDGYLNTEKTTFSGLLFVHDFNGKDTLQDLGMDLIRPLLPLSLGGGFKVEGEVSDRRQEVTIQTETRPLSVRFDKEFFGAFDSFSLEGGLGVGWGENEWTLFANDCVTRSRGATLYGNGQWSSSNGWNGEMELNSLDLDTLSDFIGLPLGGKLSLSKTEVTGKGPNLAPSRLRVTDGMVDGIELGDISGRLSLNDGNAILDEAQLAPGSGSVGARVKVKVLDSGSETSPQEFPFQVSNLRAENVQLGFVTPVLKGSSLDLKKGKLRENW